MRGAKGEVAGVGRGVESPLRLGMPAMLYLLLWLACKRGRELAGTGGGVFVPAPLSENKLLVDLVGLWEEWVVGGEDFSNHELSVELDLLRVWGRSATSPSLLELPEDGPLLSALGNEARERRRMLRSLRNEGITTR